MDACIRNAVKINIGVRQFFITWVLNCTLMKLMIKVNMKVTKKVVVHAVKNCLSGFFFERLE